MLRVSVRQDLGAITIKLEGRLAGPWAAEVDRTWVGLAAQVGSRSVSLDLCDMTYADAGGVQSLRAIYEASGARLVTNTPLSEDFAADAMRPGEKDKVS
jgi:hypothetical protein